MSKRFASKERRREERGGAAAGGAVERDSGSDSDDGVGKKTRKERAKGIVKKIKVLLP